MVGIGLVGFLEAVVELLVGERLESYFLADTIGEGLDFSLVDVRPWA